MKKTNNKGFNLVELIIVIAIMVILVAVIAPQYLKYVRNSRIATDVQTGADIATAINVAIADETLNEEKTDVDVTSLSVSNLSSSITSRLFGDDAEWDVTYNLSDGVTKLTLDDGNGNEYEVYPNPDSTDSTLPGLNSLKSN